MSPALAGRFLTTAPPGKPYNIGFELTLTYAEMHQLTKVNDLNYGPQITVFPGDVTKFK